MPSYAKAYLAAATAFVALDAAWLGAIAGEFYRSRLAHLLADEANLFAAAVFYAAYLAGVVYFCVLPGLARGRLAASAIRGAALGALAYGTYELTSLSFLKDWPLDVTLVDIVWGAALTSAAASAGHAAARTATP